MSEFLADTGYNDPENGPRPIEKIAAELGKRVVWTEGRHTAKLVPANADDAYIVGTQQGVLPLT